VILTVLLILAGILLIGLGLAGMLLPALPGPPLLYLGILALAWADNFQHLNRSELIMLGIIAAIVTILDLIATLFGTKVFGGSRWGMLGATLGILFGLPFGLIGLVLGPFLGVLIFEYGKNPDMRQAMTSSFGSFVGLVLGTFLKVGASIVMLGLAGWWAL
jgi:uncharacterized protein YqgC (DUF456 family)